MSNPHVLLCFATLVACARSWGGEAEFALAAREWLPLRRETIEVQRNLILTPPRPHNGAWLELKDGEGSASLLADHKSYFNTPDPTTPNTAEAFLTKRLQRWAAFQETFPLDDGASSYGIGHVNAHLFSRPVSRMIRFKIRGGKFDQQEVTIPAAMSIGIFSSSFLNTLYVKDILLAVDCKEDYRDARIFSLYRIVGRGFSLGGTGKPPQPEAFFSAMFAGLEHTLRLEGVIPQAFLYDFSGRISIDPSQTRSMFHSKFPAFNQFDVGYASLLPTRFTIPAPLEDSNDPAKQFYSPEHHPYTPGGTACGPMSLRLAMWLAGGYQAIDVILPNTMLNPVTGKENEENFFDYYRAQSWLQGKPKYRKWLKEKTYEDLPFTAPSPLPLELRQKVHVLAPKGTTSDFTKEWEQVDKLLAIKQPVLFRTSLGFKKGESGGGHVILLLGMGKSDFVRQLHGTEDYYVVADPAGHYFSADDNHYQRTTVTSINRSGANYGGFYAMYPKALLRDKIVDKKNGGNRVAALTIGLPFIVKANPAKSTFQATARSPVSLVLKDNQGRRAGIDAAGNVFEEIPGSSFMQAVADEPFEGETLTDPLWPKTVRIESPELNSYTLEMNAIGQGDYTLESEMISSFGATTLLEEFSGTVSPGDKITRILEVPPDDEQEEKVVLRPSLVNNQTTLRIEFQGAVERPYVLMASRDFKGWTELATKISATGTTVFEQPALDQANTFFYVRPLSLINAPIVSVQPQGLALTAGDTAQLSVLATGTPPLNYQWSRNGIAISGATNAFLTLTKAGAEDSGTFTVYAENVFGRAESREAIVTVRQTLPEILAQPEPVRAQIGETVRLAVVAIGAPAPNYQWRKNGTDLPGATEISLTLTNVQPEDAGKYTVLIENTAGKIESTEALLAIGLPLQITKQPQSLTTRAGETVILTVDAAGAAPLRYQWRKNSSSIAGATNSVLTLTNVQVSDTGRFSVLVESGSERLESAEAVVIVSDSAGGVSLTGQTLEVTYEFGVERFEFTSDSSGIYDFRAFTYTWSAVANRLRVTLPFASFIIDLTFTDGSTAAGSATVVYQETGRDPVTDLATFTLQPN